MPQSPSQRLPQPTPGAPLDKSPSSAQPASSSLHEGAAASSPVELVALVVMQVNIRCRRPATQESIIFRPDEPSLIAPGQLLTVTPLRQWSYGGHSYLSGHVERTRVDATLLGLEPLKLEERGLWDPEEQYWGEPDEPQEEWVKAILARGPQPCYEMEQVLPGSEEEEEEEEDSEDLILLSNDLKATGDFAGARELLEWMLEADLRCLDAHAHLGSLAFSNLPELALLHYEVGVRIGEQALGKDFSGVLPWGHTNNRPFLRCLHGYGLCLWRQGRHPEAAQAFERLLRLNPSDNQGARFLLPEVREGRGWVGE